MNRFRAQSLGKTSSASRNMHDNHEQLKVDLLKVYSWMAVRVH
jgi:hypothetical protein